MDDRPIIHCLVARRISDDLWGCPRRVSLQRAEALKRRQWIVVGPDPEDMIKLAAWEKKQERESLWPFAEW